MKNYGLLLLLLLCPCLLTAQPADSLLRALNRGNDTVKVNLLLQLNKEYLKEQPARAVAWAQEALQIAGQLKYNAGINKALNGIGTGYNLQGNYPLAIEYFLRLSQSASATGDKKATATAFNNIGEIYRKQGDYLHALSYHLKSLRLKEELGDKKAIANSLNNLGLLYTNQKKYDQALDYHNRALALRRLIGDKPGLSASFNNLGEIYKEQHNAIKAMEYYLKSLELDQEINDMEGVAISYNNIGEVHRRLKQNRDALQNFHKALKIQKELGDLHGSSISTNNIAKVCTSMGDFKEAIRYGLESLEIAGKIGAKPQLQQAYQQLHELYARMHMPDQAYYYQSLDLAMRDSLFNIANSQRLHDLQTTYEAEKKQSEIVLLTKEREIQEMTLRRQEIIHRGMIIGMVLIFSLAFVLHRSNRQKKRVNQLLLGQKEEIQRQAESLRLANQEITQQRDAIQQQRNLIEKKNEDIEGSIRYARRIQTALLPPAERIAKVFPLHFIFFKPRNIVSGDFYWFAEIRNADLGIQENPRKVVKAIIAVMDCTGHGVPGAFMSMIGDSLLNQIVIDKGIFSPELILDEMHRGVRKALHQEECENRDGMDMSLCVIDLENRQIEFAGANNPLILVEGNQLKEIKGDRNSIGGLQKEGERHFSRHCLEVPDPVTLYLFSDGYQDQFGGENNRKFTSRRMKDLLCEIHPYDMSMQKQLLEDTMRAWQGNNFQIDDMLIVGLKF